MTQKLEGTVTCPNCKYQQTMEIPKNSCMHSYECDNCKKTIKAEKTCCVFCDYGDRKCPVAAQHEQ